MRVIEVQTNLNERRYVVIDDEGNLVEPIARYLKYLDRVDASRHTLRSYATMLRLYWEFLSQEQLNWEQITLDDLSRFVLWLKLPTGSLKVLPAQPVAQARSNRTINHALTVVTGFYDYHWRMDAVSTNIKDKTTTFLPALWVEDVDVAENRIHICDRGELENGAEITLIKHRISVDHQDTTSVALCPAIKEPGFRPLWVTIADRHCSTRTR